MSRTYVHRPMRLELNEEGIANPWKREYSKRYPSPKDSVKVKYDKRKIKRAPIDEEEIALTNAIAHFKGHNESRNRYW